MTTIPGCGVSPRSRALLFDWFRVATQCFRRQNLFTAPESAILVTDSADSDP
ncbi:MAG: hypothetical protein KDA81_11130 [Planctomycetaceae bacterium]|nr:hypothetical protein [Planctomycetaceae bacterium]